MKGAKSGVMYRFKVCAVQKTESGNKNGYYSRVVKVKGK